MSTHIQQDAIQPAFNLGSAPWAVSRRALTTAALSALALTACADDYETPERPPDDPVTTPNYWIEEYSAHGMHYLFQIAELPEDYDPDYHEALIEGELTVDEQTGCIGLNTETDGMEGEFVLLVFPEGTEILEDERMYVPTDNGGDLKFGDDVEFGGSETDQDRVNQIATGDLTCTADRYWGVNPEY